jgi:fructuronate reductase
VRLADATLDRLGPEVERPGYDRDAQATGIVHFGIGAFHRAHQAWYTDRAMDVGDRSWMITGVSLRSAGVAEQLNPQDGLYTVTERSACGNSTRLIGAVRNVLVKGPDDSDIIASLAAPTTHIASFTITEKGYCRAADGSLDLALAGPGSIYPLLAAGLRQRQLANLSGLTLLSCDNLADNGRQLEALLAQYLSITDPTLIAWFRRECSCPGTMVDRIVPAATIADRSDLAAAIGLEDAASVMTEPFSQWVIEDNFVGPRPAWEQVGAALVANVRPYETAKLRMLNGAHSLLAYCGLRRGHSYVHQAIADPELRKLALQLMLLEAAPTIAAAPSLDFPAYAEALLARFANPALDHHLSQIAIDGSQKIPQRWLETLSANANLGQQCPAILAGLGAWIGHLRGANGPVDDPRAAELAVAASDADPLASLFGNGGLIASAWTPSDADRSIASATIASELSDLPGSGSYPQY